MIVPDPSDRRTHYLAEFLGKFGLTDVDLRAQIDDTFGDSKLVVATGSVLQGFANATSDIDLFVIVDREVQGLPILSFTGGARIDITFHTVAAVKQHVDRLHSAWPAKGPLPQREFVARKRALDILTRFALSLPIGGTQSWREWRHDLEAPWLRDAVVQWWEVDAIRKWEAARFFASRRPLLGRQRYYEAALAALERRAALAGQIYFVSGTAKWLPEKFAAIGDDEGLRRCLSVLDLSDVGYETTVERLLREELGGGTLRTGWQIELTPLEGIESFPIDGRTLVSRWQGRYVEIPGHMEFPCSDKAFWRGDLGTEPPLPWDILMEEGMVWMSVVAR